MESINEFQSDMESFKLINSDHFTIGYYTQKNPEGEGLNEDALGFLTFNQIAILAIADGVGGSPKGEEASKIAVETLIQQSKINLTPPLKKNALRNNILDSIEKANQTLLSNNNGARTTFTGCEIDKNILRNYQIGDSSLIVCGQKGLLKYKAIEQSPVGYGVEAGIYNEKTALLHPQRNLVSNVMGEAEMRIEIGPPIELAPHDTVLLASDGLFDNFLSDELVEMIRKETLEEVMTKLTDICQGMRDEKRSQELYKLDDVSFIVCRMKA